MESTAGQKRRPPARLCPCLRRALGTTAAGLRPHGGRPGLRLQAATYIHEHTYTYSAVCVCTCLPAYI